MASGGIEPGESSWEAAFREMYEETGLNPDRMYSSDAVEMFYMRERDQILLGPVFVAIVNEKKPITLSPTEHDDYAWLPLEQAIERLEWSEQKRIIRHIHEHFVLSRPSHLLTIDFRIFPKLSLETDRLRIRRFQESDAEEMAAILDHSEIRRFAIHNTFSIEQTRELLHYYIEEYMRRPMGVYALTEKGSNALIGYCGLEWHRLGNTEMPELIYCLAHSKWGQGFVREAATALKSYAATDCGISSLSSFIHPQNTRSIAVATALGALLDGQIEIHGQSKLRYVYT